MPAADALSRTLVTPEGVDLRLTLGSGGQRASAFAIDVALLIALLVGFTLLILLVMWLTGFGGAALIGALWVLGAFLLRNAWFVGWECSRHGATPGKRWTGLRVVARDGGRLTADAVVARNAMREIELFLPLSFLGAGAAEHMVDAWTALLGFGWSAIFLFFPLLNRDRLRVGDLLAGTWVIAAPTRTLGLDLAASGEAAPGGYRFTRAQLEAYGILELQTLEDVLRRDDWQQLHVVAEAVRARLGLPHGGDDTGLLRAYYGALRRHLERDLLFGVRRDSKHEARRRV